MQEAPSLRRCLPARKKSGESAGGARGRTFSLCCLATLEKNPGRETDPACAEPGFFFPPDKRHFAPPFVPPCHPRDAQQNNKTNRTQTPRPSSNPRKTTPRHDFWLWIWVAAIPFPLFIFQLGKAVLSQLIPCPSFSQKPKNVFPLSPFSKKKKKKTNFFTLSHTKKQPQTSLLSHQSSSFQSSIHCLQVPLFKPTSSSIH